MDWKNNWLENEEKKLRYDLRHPESISDTKTFASIILLILILSSIHLSASNCKEYWVRAVECCTDKNYQEAENNFTLAIYEMEDERDYENSHVYLDRARLYMLQEKNLDSLSDLNKAISLKYLNEEDFKNAMVTRCLVNARLGNQQASLRDLEILRESCEFPKVEYTQERIIIRNIPDCDCYREIISKSFLNSGICQHPSDIQMLSSGICLVNRNTFDTTCRINRNIENCKYKCDKVTFLGISYCAQVFKTKHCQFACLAAVDLLKDGCYHCCRDGDFYGTCIKPFEDILGAMNHRCDPEWD